jgi:antagonist of KipI
VGGIRVIAPGLQTTVQDRGRWGFQALGVSVAGPVDPVSHRLANALVGNAPDCATLEITLTGPELEFDDERLVVVAGAPFAIAVNGKPHPANTALLVQAGARLRVGERGRGARAYIGIEGGLDVPLVLGSRSTHMRSRMGGFRGRALTSGDRIPLCAPRLQPRRRVSSRRAPEVSATLERLLALPARVRVLPGPQHDRFVAGALDVLQSAPYTVTKDSDRMGFRLSGPALRHRSQADVISDATPIGTLQVPGSGQPVLLMADRQTTGGYAKLATVITADIPVAAQRAPGDALAFELCTFREALAAVIAQERALMRLEEAAAW